MEWVWNAFLSFVHRSERRLIDFNSKQIFEKKLRILLSKNEKYLKRSFRFVLKLFTPILRLQLFRDAKGRVRYIKLIIAT